VTTWGLLATNLALLVVVMSVAAVPSFRTGDPSYVDGVWGLGFVLVALSSLVLADGDAGRQALLVGITAVWGLRLSTYLFRRWRRNGPDARYQAMLARATGSRAVFLWTRVFLLQGVLVVVVGLPVQLGQVGGGRLTAVNALGAALALVGIAYESVADLQLARFKADPAHHGQVMDRGLWRTSRHPNYFGEACTWWGIGLVALHGAASAVGLLGPALLTAFLLRWSGVGPLERQLHTTKPRYADYVRRTSAFLPRRPRERSPR
jgi:steroid 5-alpha reductase family enzyme